MFSRLLIALTLCTLTACSAPPDDPATLRLVDLFPQATVSTVGGNSTAESTAIEPGGWNFAEAPTDPQAPWADTHGWRAAIGVADLGRQGERLSGRSTTDFPILHVEPTPHSDPEDLLHAVELRLKISAGANVSLSFSRDEEPNWQQVLGRASTFPWTAEATIEPGEMRSVTVRPGVAVKADRIHHLLLRPTDAAGARFDIESVRLVFRQEHLALAPAGIGWHDMSSIYREALTTHDGEVARFPLTLPAEARIDLALAMIEDGPVTFRAAVQPAGGDIEIVVLERTLTTPHRWRPVAVDLSAFAGQDIQLALSVNADRPGALGFWGTPTVRSRRSAPPAATGAESGDRIDRPRGVIVIVGDTLRADHLNLWGYGRETAPILTGLAEAGAWAEDCISQATWTKVSVPSIFTSRYPLSHGVRSITDRLPASAVTMAELFRDAGYATLGLSSIPFTGRVTNLHQGYEEFHESASLPRDGNAKTARRYVDRLLDWLERHHDVPFFIFLHVADPHSPYLPYPPYDVLWGEPGDSEEYQRQQDETRPFIEDPLMKNFGMPERQHLIAAGIDPERYVELEHNAYDGSIRAMDVEIGRITERLRQLGLAEETLIAFISDHGTEFLDHDRHFHGHSVYGELNRVPFILSGHNVPAGVVISETIQTIDMMPTMLELSGLEHPAGMQGQSLVPRLRAGGSSDEATAERWRPRPAFTEKADSGDDDRQPGLPAESYSIVLDGWKLIHNTRRDDDHPEFELYDHRADPLNHRDVSAVHPQRVEQLATQLTAWRETAAADRLTSDADLSAEMNAEDLERLRSLGYVQ